MAYDFFPVQQTKLNKVGDMLKDSKIIEQKHITVDFLTEVLPKGL